MVLRTIWIAVLVMSMLLMACADPVVEELGEEMPLMHRVDTPVQVDGQTADYPGEGVAVAGAEVHLAHHGDALYVHVRADVDGWISVGLNAQGGGMDGANMILGYMDGDMAASRDDVGRGRTHSEVSETAIEGFFLAREDEARVMEFSYPVAFPGAMGYRVDRMAPGQVYTLLVAYHADSDDIARRHTRYGSFDFMFGE